MPDIEPRATPEVIRTSGPDYLWDLPLRRGKVFGLGCTHFPHTHERAFHAALDRMVDWAPDLIVHGGDILDNQSLSCHPTPKPPTLLTDEREQVAPWIERLDRAASKTPARMIHGIMGNHDEWFERLSNKHPGIYLAFDYHQYFGFPQGWRIYGNQTKLRLGGLGSDGLLLLHGDLRMKLRSGGSVPAASLRRALKANAISWHFHRHSVAMPEEISVGGVRQRRAWTVGWLGDPRSIQYITSPDWTIDIVEVDFGGPGDFEVRVHTWDQTHNRFLIDGRRYT